ncbi:16S rRNA (uracil(1498)-N(3))-methyltransferase [Rufibacter glacialis]|uniref:Ribosomal RNA small subunit methyltransferase E n=1 Tax=Rufibacter glacialis TaxID=1259555 RepID=A0A5M8QHX8_9BACT|nr:16S rRNA (uracil(1498)-N(3))-methyltransferase [Rufibacter glacialis]KAA6434396.1 16S rRNA (uracil(1498)-N(3))-methyltransferase [Rufibacter glacialis]GGK69196.1 ribosomal RNA small subunit methyltransferase E [Rufibacter glacialis]
MHLFFTPDLLPSDTSYTLSEEESKHCTRVLRLGQGDAVTLIDGQGGMFEAQIAEPNPKKTKISILRHHAEYQKRPYQIHVAVAPTKNMDRMEWFVEKAVEMGIDEITFLQCARSERKNLNLERQVKIAVSAMKQSMKAYLPTLHPLTRYADFLQRPLQGQRFIAHLVEGQERQSLAKSITAPDTYTILIGPEGDFSPEEVAQALQAGFKPVTLGQSRLRTETAALAACHTIHVLLDV